MSDKSKRLRDDAEIHRRFLEGRRRFPPQKPLACQCGKTIYEAEIVAHAPDRWTAVVYYCAVCLPEELR